MIPREFDYHAPKTLPDALGLLQQFGDDAKLLAGGHSLLPMMKLRFAQPGHLIDLGRIAELKGIREDAGTIVIGAMTTENDDRLVEAAAGEVPAARRGRAADLRSAGALQGDDRRRHLARRPRQRSPRADAGVVRVVRAARREWRACRAGERILPRHLRYAARARRDHDGDPHSGARGGHRLLLRETQAQDRRLRDGGGCGAAAVERRCGRRRAHRTYQRGTNAAAGNRR